MSALRVAVLGGGTMGNGIAQLAATAGHDVAVRDVSDARLEACAAAIGHSLDRFVRAGRLSEHEARGALGRVTFSTETAAVAEAADVVIEAVPEVLELKHQALSEAASHAREDAVLGTNTSQLSITSIASGLGAAAPRVVGIHFFNPPVMMRLVELIAALQTAPAILERARGFAEDLGRDVVVCRKDSPGFITSRAYAILRLECVRMLEEGIASAADIDKAMRLGFNFPMGPLELGDMNGLDTYLHAIDGLAAAHGDRFRATVGLRNMVAARRLGRKAGSGFYEYPEPVDTDRAEVSEKR